VLTEAGYDRLRGATGTHLRGVAQHAMGRLDDTQAEQLSTLMARILDDPQGTGVSPAG
jgi:hypothetical protein